jgi:hypothetical protein
VLFIEGRNFLMSHGGFDLDVLLTNVLEPAVAVDAFFAACAFHQDASHGSGAAIPFRQKNFFGGFCRATSRH